MLEGEKHGHVDSKATSDSNTNKNLRHILMNEYIDQP